MMIKCVVFIAAIAALIACIDAGCTQGQTQDVCKYSTARLNGDIGTVTYNICADINKNPFSRSPVFSQAGIPDGTCQTLVRQDGNKCIKFYARLQCAGACRECTAFDICPEFCDNYEANCPTATQANCFAHISCAAVGQDCTAWPIDDSNLPSPISTTASTGSTSSTSSTTSGSTTTRSRTTTTSGDTSDASVNASISTVIGLFLIFVIALAV